MKNRKLLIGFALVLIALACGSGPDRTGPPPTRKIIERLVTKTPALALAQSPPTRTPTSEPARLISPTELPSVAVPSPVSTEPPTAEVLLPRATASENTVNLRAGPGTGYDLAGSLPLGESLEIAGRNGDSSWWQVSGPNGLAWVAASVVTAEHTSDAIAVVEAPPMPTPPPPVATPVPAVVEPVSPLAAPVVAATAVPPAAAPDCNCSVNTYNCGDAQAQTCFSYCLSVGAGDVHDLDRDNDGQACEKN